MPTLFTRDTKPDTAAQRQRKLAWIAGGLFAVAGAVLLTMLLLVNRANARPTMRDLEAQQVQRIEEENARLDRADINEAHINKAKLLREKWKTWAMLHKDVLRRMLHASPGDQDAFRAVYDALPQPMLSSSKPDISYDDLNSGGEPFTWEAPLHVSVKPEQDPSLRDQYATLQEQRQNQVVGNFRAYHDVMLSTAVNDGPTQTALWASGRITKQHSSVKRTTNGSRLSPDPLEEVVPPYDELR